MTLHTRPRSRPRPTAYATVTGHTARYTAPDGHTEPLTEPDGDIRQTVLTRTTTDARTSGETVELVTAGDRGTHHLLVAPDGTITALPDEPPATDLATEPDPDLELSDNPHAPALEGEEEVPELRSTRRNPDPDAPVQTRATFIAPPAPAREAVSGWRGVLARVGVPVGPSRAERERAERVRAVSRHWAGCRTIAVANGKGGVGKTMTTAMLAAVFARHGGGNVLAWDNNDTRGTLGWRTEQGLYDTTLRDLLPAADELLSPTAGVSDIARFVHHQTHDRYDVLRSNPELLASDQRITTTQFDLLAAVAARYYRLVIFDSGNDESADRWLRMIDSAFQLVIPTLPTAVSAESAALLLDALRTRDEHSAALADNAVVLVTTSEPAHTKEARRIATEFEPLVRAVDVIPHDAALSGVQLRFDALRPRTRDAWLRAAAHTATGL